MSSTIAEAGVIDGPLALAEQRLSFALKALASLARGQVEGAEEALDALQALIPPPVPAPPTAPARAASRQQAGSALLRLVSWR